MIESLDPVALDTSAAVPYLMLSHPAHQAIRRQLRNRRLHLTTHSLAETCSVVTRLPGDARLAPPDAAAPLSANFHEAVAPDNRCGGRSAYGARPVGHLGRRRVRRPVGLAAHAAVLVLITRDARAVATYAAVGASVQIGASSL